MNIYLELTPEQYKRIRDCVKQATEFPRCYACGDEGVVRIVAGQKIRSWGTPAATETFQLLGALDHQARVQLEVAEYESP